MGLVVEDLEVSTTFQGTARMSGARMPEPVEEGCKDREQ